MNLLEVMDDEKLFGAAFPGPTWRAWRAFIGTLMGLPMTEDLRSTARACTGREDVHAVGAYREAWLVCGRRAGKSRILAAVAVFLAAFTDWRPRLAAGETGVILILAADRDQAGVILGYVRGLLTGNPMLKSLVIGDTAERIDLTGRVSIQVGTSSYRSVRGRTVIAALLDEIAFWRSDDSANPAGEVVRAVRPALASLAPDSLLLAASSPYSRSGALWDAYRRHFGKVGSRTLVWQAPSRVMNPSLPAELVADALQEDEEAARAEYLAEFRRDVAAFVDRLVVEGLVIPGRHELPPAEGVTYRAFVDPSGGSADSFTLAIAHKEGDAAVLDCVREVRPPFSPESVVEEFCALLKSYRVGTVTGDRYAGEWPREQFRKRGVTYEPSAKSKSELYLELLPLLNAGRLQLLEVPRLVPQLTGLERRTSRSGRDSVDHGPGGHDDLVNAVAGVLVDVAAPAAGFWIAMGGSEMPPMRGIGRYDNLNPDPWETFYGDLAEG